MKIRKNGYWFLFTLTIVFTLAAILTVVPSNHASEISLLGYKAYCSFAPISTLLCLIPAGISCFVRKRFFVSYK